MNATIKREKKMEFVRFGCGCLGIKCSPVGEIVIDHCGGNDDGFNLGFGISSNFITHLERCAF